MINSAKELIYDRFITPTRKSRTNYIGIEIEMPIVNLKGIKNVKFFINKLLIQDKIFFKVNCNYRDVIQCLD